MNIEQHIPYMYRCLEIAKNAMGHTSPNPMVGSVIVYNNQIIGEGYHTKAGLPHAEVNAINSVFDKSILNKSTLYVNLEPCSHFGKTPPCSHLIVNMKIPEVVIGCSDPFSKVNGVGIEYLKRNNVNVISGILEQQSMDLNCRFITYHKFKRPYIILKWAQTSDNYIDILRTSSTPIGPNWITGQTERILVHKWRTEENAIMIGTNTAEKDNPFLTARDFYGHSPVRIVIDRNLRLNSDLNIFSGKLPTIVFTDINTKFQNQIATGLYQPEIIQINFEENMIGQIMEHLFQKTILSVIVEGGAKLLNAFIKASYWDEVRVFTGNKAFGSGLRAPNIEGVLTDYVEFTNSKLHIYKNIKL